MTVKARLAAATGKYTGKDGAEKTRRANVGHMHAGQYGDYLTLDTAALIGVCLAALVRGEDRLMVSMFEAEEGQGQGQPPPPRESGEAPRPAKASPPAKSGKVKDPPFDDPIPF